VGIVYMALLWAWPEEPQSRVIPFHHVLGATSHLFPSNVLFRIYYKKFLNRQTSGKVPLSRLLVLLYTHVQVVFFSEIFKSKS
jgi:hypothetical protein